MQGVGLVGIVVDLLRLAEGLLVVGGAVTLGSGDGEGASLGDRSSEWFTALSFWLQQYGVLTVPT